MPFLSMALVIAAIAGAFVTGGALDRGFPVEVSIVRGALAFMAIAFAGYLGELVVVTAPRRERATVKQPAQSEEPQESHEPAARQTAPRLIAPAPLVDEDSNEDDADVELRPAA